jgi:hypothetical protein
MSALIRSAVVRVLSCARGLPCVFVHRTWTSRCAIALLHSGRLLIFSFLSLS